MVETVHESPTEDPVSATAKIYGKAVRESLKALLKLEALSRGEGTERMQQPSRRRAPTKVEKASV